MVLYAPIKLVLLHFGWKINGIPSAISYKNTFRKAACVIAGRLSSLHFYTLAMILCQLLNLQAGHFTLRHADVKKGVVTLVMESRSKRCRCPLCNQFSNHVHNKASCRVLKFLALKHHWQNRAMSPPIYPYRILHETSNLIIRERSLVTNATGDISDKT